MTFSNEWNNLYRAQKHLSIWPWSDLVNYMIRYARPKGAEYKVLELGCGAGANIPFFRSFSNVQYFAVEGSESIVNELRRKYPDLKSKIRVGDFTRNIPFQQQFDLVVDRASVTHNSTKSILSCVQSVHEKLKEGGKYIGIDWFSTKHSDYAIGPKIIDNYTRSGYIEGSFAGCGRVHFSDEKHLRELFSKFFFEILEEKIVSTEYPCTNNIFASFNFVSRKE